MHMTSTTDGRSFAEVEHQWRLRGAELTARAVASRPAPPARLRPKVALVRPASELPVSELPASELPVSKLPWDDVALALHRRAALPSPRRLLDFCLLILFCVGAAFILWINWNASSCSPKIYRDPVTGRMASSASPRELAKVHGLCARLGYAPPASSEVEMP